MNTKKGINIFIVEDNEVYAKSLQVYLLTHFPNIKEINIFPVGEMCLIELHRNPDIVIMDYFLNSKYSEAHNGLEIIGSIKAQKPQTSIIVLSVQIDFNIIVEAINQYDCIFVQKGKEAFNKVEQIIKKIISSRHLA